MNHLQIVPEMRLKAKFKEPQQSEWRARHEAQQNTKK